MRGLLILISCLFLGCETPAGFGGVSEDINESKRREVFVKEYIASPNPYKINDTLQLTVKEAWLEKHWFHGKTEEETYLYPDEKYQLCINTEEKDLKGICFEWSIGLNGDKYIIISGKNSLMGDFKSIPNDTIQYKVQKGNELSNNYEKIIIGKFVLMAKK